jgi:hypothetical protein
MLQLNGGAFVCLLLNQHPVRSFLATIREELMDHDNRVLTRRGARELSEQEVETVTGAFKIRRTLTPCFVDSKQQLINGDQAIGECGP